MTADLPLNFHPAAVRVSVVLQRDRTLDHSKLEFYDSKHVGGLVAPSRFCSKIGSIADRPMGPFFIIQQGSGKPTEPFFARFFIDFRPWGQPACPLLQVGGSASGSRQLSHIE